MASFGLPTGFATTAGVGAGGGDNENDNDGAVRAAKEGAVKVASKRRARQYMNRRGGFNRPLPAEKTGERVKRD